MVVGSSVQTLPCFMHPAGTCTCTVCTNLDVPWLVQALLHPVHDGSTATSRPQGFSANTVCTEVILVGKAPVLRSSRRARRPSRLGPPRQRRGCLLNVEVQALGLLQTASCRGRPRWSVRLARSVAEMVLFATPADGFNPIGWRKNKAVVVVVHVLIACAARGNPLELFDEEELHVGRHGTQRPADELGDKRSNLARHEHAVLMPSESSSLCSLLFFDFAATNILVRVCRRRVSSRSSAYPGIICACLSHSLLGQEVIQRRLANFLGSALHQHQDEGAHNRVHLRTEVGVSVFYTSALPRGYPWSARGGGRFDDGRMGIAVGTSTCSIESSRACCRCRPWSAPFLTLVVETPYSRKAATAHLHHFGGRETSRAQLLCARSLTSSDWMDPNSEVAGGELVSCTRPGWLRSNTFAKSEETREFAAPRSGLSNKPLTARHPRDPTIRDKRYGGVAVVSVSHLILLHER